MVDTRCPFCASDRLSFQGSGRTECNQCGAVGPDMLLGVPRGEAPKWCWGSRPLEDELRKLLEDKTKTPGSQPGEAPHLEA